MLISLLLTVLSVISISCLASAFSTQFVMEEVGEGKKMEEVVTKTQKTEGNSINENQVIVETIPFFTDVFTKVEDVMNLTPLKVATVISAQHLLNTVKNIPVAGNLPQDTLNMLSNIVEEFNKTTQIIKLTAEFVNISSHYILNSLNTFAKENCDEELTKSTMKTINRYFLGVISNHVKVAVREITKKTEHREMTGTDVLVSSAYHIVAAFQEMTNQVMSLKIDNTKCDLSKIPQNSEQTNVIQTNDSDTSENSKQEITHKSIKKDQALPNTEPIFTFPNQINLQDPLNIGNIVQNQDLTIEIFPREPLILNNKDTELLAKQEVKIPESLKVAFLPEQTKTKQKYNKRNKENQSHLDSEDDNKRITKKNLKNVGDVFTIENVKSNEDLAVDIFSPKILVNSNKQESSSKMDENKQKRLESFSVFYYPLTKSQQNQNYLPSANKDSLRMPNNLNIHYSPQSLKTQTYDNMHRERLKQKITPFKSPSLFENYNSENYNDGKLREKEYSKKKSDGSQTNFKSFDDTLTIENLNRQDLTVEVFSPEAFIHNGKDESSLDARQERMDFSNIKEMKFPLHAELRTSSFENGKSKKHIDPLPLRHSYHKYLDIKSHDWDSAIQNLGNVPPVSFEPEIKRQRGRKAIKEKTKTNKGLPTVLMPWGKGAQQFQRAFFHKSQQKHNPCDERVEPVCGINKNKSNFIIFLNDCQRKHHNSKYKTSYEWANMDTCVGFLLKYSSGKPTKYTNITPQ